MAQRGMLDIGKTRYFSWLLLIIFSIWHSTAQAVELPITKTAAPETVFGGVGRLYESWHVGYDMMIMSTPHTSAHRNLGVTNRSLWLEWWPSDRYGMKGFYAMQHFQSFGSNLFDIDSRHVGGMFKGRFPINTEWQISAGIGMAQTDTELAKKTLSSTMIVSEFRIGVKIFSNWVMELGMMTLDGASGDGPDDDRLGSTNYIVGLGFGF
jgi:hypothetical protein